MENGLAPAHYVAECMPPYITRHNEQGLGMPGAYIPHHNEQGLHHSIVYSAAETARKRAFARRRSESFLRERERERERESTFWCCSSHAGRLEGLGDGEETIRARQHRMGGATVFSFLFGDDQFMRRYHKVVNEDPDAEISSWTADGKRTVRFTAPLNAPALVRRFIGTDVLRISELQQYERCGNCFTVKSDPVVEGAAGELFSTTGNVLLEPSKTGTGCVVTMNAILCCKTAVWGIQGTVEAFMETKATKSFEEWMEVASQFCAEQLALAGTSPMMHHKTSEDAFSSDESFYDPEEEVMEVGNQTFIVNNIMETAKPIESIETTKMGGVTGVADCDAWFPQAIVQQLSDLRSSNEESRAHIKKLEVELHRLEGGFGILMSQLQVVQLQQQYLHRQALLGLVGLGVTTALLFGIGHAYLKSHR
ncbi:unnamed protein product [Sphagnum jensenii]|uniref:VASt domain-containing protein n=1 Tax=Sphagnum jensenii TaxID=128206 RepID=A0ABP1BCF1_9BRYO